MLPGLTKDNSANTGLVDTKSGGDPTLRQPRAAQCKDLPNLSFVQLGGAARFAPGVAFAAFLRAISTVIQFRSKEQMGRTKAGRVIAAMERKESSADRTYCKFVGNAMDRAATVLEFDLAVPKSDLTAWPLHTGIVRGYGFQKFFQQFEIANLVSHLEALQWLRCMASLALERCGASFILPQQSLAKGTF